MSGKLYPEFFFIFPGSVDVKKNKKKAGFYMLQNPALLYYSKYLPIQE